MTVGCAGPVHTIKSDAGDPSAATEITCQFPTNPANMFSSLVINYKEAMHYISFGEKACSKAYAEQLKQEVQDSIWVTEGCTKVTLQDIDDALHNPEELNKRLHYY